MTAVVAPSRQADSTGTQLFASAGDHPASNGLLRANLEVSFVSTTSSDALQALLPELGESVTEGIIVEWRVAEGDHVEKDQTLLDLTTDKVDVEVLMDDPASMSRADTPLWDAVQRAVNVPFPDARLNPQFIVGFTDSRVFRDLGAVAYGFLYCKIPLAGVTPIEEMLVAGEIDKEAATSDRGAQKAAAWRHLRTQSAAVLDALESGERPDSELLSQALALNAFSVVAKPVSIKMLLDQIDRLFVKYYGSDVFSRLPLPGRKPTGNFFKNRKKLFIRWQSHSNERSGEPHEN